MNAPLQLSHTIAGEHATLSVTGRFHYEETNRFRVAYEAVLDNPAVRSIDIDLGTATYIDSSALGVMLAMRERTRSAGKTVSLVNAHGDVRQVLLIARFDTLFRITP